MHIIQLITTNNMPYYKIIGNNFGNFNYKLGLNCLSDNNETFDSDPVCGPGGLYFCDITHIFECLEYGDKVCTIELPEDAQVVKVENKYKADKIIITDIDVLYDDEVIQKLIKSGAKINHDVLRRAFYFDHIDVVKVLLKNGADVNACTDWEFKIASSEFQVEMVKLLLDYGANVHASDDYLLCFAAEVGNIRLVKLLLEYGANVHDDALELAQQEGHSEILNLLLQQQITN